MIAGLKSGEDVLDVSNIAGGKFEDFSITYADAKTLLSNEDANFLLTFYSVVSLTESDFGFDFAFA